MLFPRHAARDEYSEMADRFMDRVNDGLAVFDDVLDIIIDIKNPSKCLLGWRYVIAPRAKHHDRRADVAYVDDRAVDILDHAGCELVTDEQLVDNKLDLLGIQIDVPAPIFVKPKIPWALSVDLSVEIILLGPQSVGGILVFKILYQPRAVELAATKVAGERGQPTPAQKTARVAHRILAVHAGPVGERRTGDDNGAEQLGT